jgi:hypothetical protein
LEKLRQQESDEMRFQFLDDRLKQAILENKMTQAEAIRNVKKIEYKLRCHKTIRRYTTPSGSTGLSHILQEKEG